MSIDLRPSVDNGVPSATMREQHDVEEIIRQLYLERCGDSFQF
jgi:hypothetical protein